ncbi:MAG: glycerol-3-phosphate 1-O-acyltransferase PlsY [Candidatus Eisenbacteria bacterium]
MEPGTPPGLAAPLGALGALLLGYLCGALPFGLWVGRAFRGVDVRTLGSGNSGATNVYRTLGPGLGILTLLLDALKGAIPVWLAPSLPGAEAIPGGPDGARILAGLAAVAGHVWTFLAGFRGGKGVATTAGVLLALSPAAFGIFAAVFVVTVAVTRYISLGSMLGSVAFAAALAWLPPGGVGQPRFVFGALIALLVVARHRENIVRLLRGTERRFSFRREGAS